MPSRRSKPAASCSARAEAAAASWRAHDPHAACGHPRRHAGARRPAGRGPRGERRLDQLGPAAALVDEPVDLRDRLVDPVAADIDRGVDRTGVRLAAGRAAVDELDLAVRSTIAPRRRSASGGSSRGRRGRGPVERRGTTEQVPGHAPFRVQPERLVRVSRVSRLSCGGAERTTPLETAAPPATAGAFADRRRSSSPAPALGLPDARRGQNQHAPSRDHTSSWAARGARTRRTRSETERRRHVILRLSASAAHQARCEICT